MIQLWQRDLGTQQSTDIVPILLGKLYRAPDAGLEATESLTTELEGFGDQFVGTVILGDMNVHHERWLRFSNGNTALAPS